jgi:hypothetical protein
MNVTGIRESEWNKDGTVVKVSNVTFDDGREAPGYDLPPGLEQGKPLPEGWEIATAKSGKLYIKVPKAGGKGGGYGGGAAAFRNTKEGQAVEQERMDRRTALMQALIGARDAGHGDVLAFADRYYEWLRRTAGIAPAVPSGTPAAQPTSSTAQVGMKAAAGRGQESVPVGEAEAGSCSHELRLLTKLDGSPLPTGYSRCGDCGTILGKGK